MPLPDKLQHVVDDFRRAPKPLRLQLLLEYARKVPDLPPELAADPSSLERVHECQTPFFLATDVTDDGVVILHFDAPEEAPTTRGFAGILSEGLRGESAAAVAGVPDDFYTDMGLAEVISPLRLRGMSAIMHRLKRQLAERGAV
jgi:cysteine desulfuration protein SufE